MQNIRWMNIDREKNTVATMSEILFKIGIALKRIKETEKNEVLMRPPAIYD